MKDDPDDIPMVYLPYALFCDRRDRGRGGNCGHQNTLDRKNY